MGKNFCGGNSSVGKKNILKPCVTLFPQTVKMFNTPKKLSYPKKNVSHFHIIIYPNSPPRFEERLKTTVFFFESPTI